MTTDIIRIGKRVKSYRIQRNMTQAELAERLGLSNVYVSNIETGRKGVSLVALLKIADVFELSLDDLALENPPVRLPRSCHTLAGILAGCDDGKIELVTKIVAAYLEFV